MSGSGVLECLATVWSVEKGERPLRLAEAETLAGILGITVDNFTKTENAVRLAVANSQMHGTYERLRQVVDDFFEAQLLLAATEDAAISDSDASGVLQVAVESWLHTCPEDVCEEVRTTREVSVTVEN